MHVNEEIFGIWSIEIVGKNPNPKPPIVHHTVHKQRVGTKLVFSMCDACLIIVFRVLCRVKHSARIN